jgi:hypothetical protein
MHLKAIREKGSFTLSGHKFGIIIAASGTIAKLKRRIKIANAHGKIYE